MTLTFGTSTSCRCPNTRVVSVSLLVAIVNPTAVIASPTATDYLIVSYYLGRSKQDDEQFCNGGQRDNGGERIAYFLFSSPGDLGGPHPQPPARLPAMWAFIPMNKTLPKKSQKACDKLMEKKKKNQENYSYAYIKWKKSRQKNHLMKEKKMWMNIWTLARKVEFILAIFIGGTKKTQKRKRHFWVSAEMWQLSVTHTRALRRVQPTASVGRLTHTCLCRWLTADMIMCSHLLQT